MSEEKNTKVEESRIDQILPDAKNANKGTERGQYMLTESLQQFGAGRSILLDKEGRVIAGNKTLEVAAAIGLDDVVIVHTTGNKLVAVMRDDLDLEDDDNAARLLAYADNRTSEVGLAWLPEQVVADLDGGLDLSALFRDDELEAIIEAAYDPDAGGGEDPGAQMDRADELQEKWQVQPGQVWRAGPHRLMCGDSTSAGAVSRLMGGAKAGLVWTDPPYGVKYGEKMDAQNPMGYKVRDIKNDDLTPEELEELVGSALTLAVEVTKPGAVLYLASPAGTLLPTLISAFSGSGFEFHWGLVWVKDQLVLGRGDYHFRHENILYGWKHDAAHFFVKSRKHDSIFEVDRPKVSKEHPTMKPVELVAQMIENSSRRGWIVYDCFFGSGTTFVACERTERIGYGMELVPKYVAVTLERLSDMGLETELVEE